MQARDGSGSGFCAAGFNGCAYGAVFVSGMASGPSSPIGVADFVGAELRAPDDEIAALVGLATKPDSARARALALQVAVMVATVRKSAP